MRYRFVQEALDEYVASGLYYNRQLSGLGDDFMD